MRDPDGEKQTIVDTQRTLAKVSRIQNDVFVNT